MSRYTANFAPFDEKNTPQKPPQYRIVRFSQDIPKKKRLSRQKKSLFFSLMQCYVNLSRIKSTHVSMWHWEMK